jgi:hypothetical protein
MGYIHDADSIELPAGNGLEAKGMAGVLSIDALDRRCRPFKRYEAIRGAVLSDMGGAENTSEVQRQLISKFSTIALQLELLEAAAIEGNQIDLDLFGRCAGHMRRIAETLGLRRVPVAVPTLAEHLAQLEPEQAAAAGEEAA